MIRNNPLLSKSVNHSQPMQTPNGELLSECRQRFAQFEKGAATVQPSTTDQQIECQDVVEVLSAAIRRDTGFDLSELHALARTMNDQLPGVAWGLNELNLFGVWQGMALTAGLKGQTIAALFKLHSHGRYVASSLDMHFPNVIKG